MIAAREAFDKAEQLAWPVVTLWGIEIDIAFIAWRSYVVLPHTAAQPHRCAPAQSDECGPQ